jgi:ABC-type branched-subunit amino acid transport system substrate-binding protein
MKPSIPRGARTAILSITILLVASACSIQPPDITLQGGGTGTGGGTTGVTTGSAATTTGVTAGTGGTSGTAAGTTGAAPNANDTSCVGKVPPGVTGVSATEIKLGSTFAASGPVSSISGPIFKGVQSYYNKVNSEAGVFGRRIKLVWYDDGWDAQKGKSFIKKLVEQDRVFVLSVVPSSNGLDAAASYLESKKMPVFGTSGLIESQFKSAMQWPVGTSTRSAARIGLIDAKNRGVSNFAIVWLDLLAGAEARDAIIKSAPSIFGKPIEDLKTAERRVSLSETDFGPVWATIQSDTAGWQRNHHVSPADGKPDFVIFAIDPTNTIKAMNAASQKNFQPRKGWGGGQPLFLNVVAQHNWARKTGLFAGSSYYPPQVGNVPAVQDYVKTVQKYYGSSVDTTNPFLEGGYAGAAMTVEIMKRSGSCLTREKTIQVANSLTNYSPAGLTRPLTYKPGDHYANTSYLIAQVQPDGSWKVVTDWIVDPTPGK